MCSMVTAYTFAQKWELWSFGHSKENLTFARNMWSTLLRHSSVGRNIESWRTPRLAGVYAGQFKLIYTSNKSHLNCQVHVRQSGTAVVNPGRDINAGHHYGTMCDSTINEVAQGGFHSPVLRKFVSHPPPFTSFPIPIVCKSTIDGKIQKGWRRVYCRELGER